MFKWNVKIFILTRKYIWYSFFHCNTASTMQQHIAHATFYNLIIYAGLLAPTYLEKANCNKLYFCADTCILRNSLWEATPLNRPDIIYQTYPQANLGNTGIKPRITSQSHPKQQLMLTNRTPASIVIAATL